MSGFRNLYEVAKYPNTKKGQKGGWHNSKTKQRERRFCVHIRSTPVRVE
ncbi:MAG: hypothetical protein ACR2MD_04965 [Aridibacter sp.]